LSERTTNGGKGRKRSDWRMEIVIYSSNNAQKCIEQGEKGSIITFEQIFNAHWGIRCWIVKPFEKGRGFRWSIILRGYPFSGVI
jgi:hypothetical protein